MRNGKFCTIISTLVFITILSGGWAVSKPPMSPAANRATAANTTFGLNLFSRLSDGQNENVFVSPASIVWCLSMLVNGAQGATRDEIVKALSLEGVNIQSLNQVYRDWRNSWGTLDPKVELDVANSIWSRRGLAVKPEFVELNRTYYGAEVSELDFNNPKSLVDINTWVKNKTRGRIPKIVDQISPDSVLFLINAIYFNGKWSAEFDPARTKEEVFTDSANKTLNVPMMRQHGTFAYLENENMQAISLPYGNKRLSMYVFLPSKESNLKAFQQSLTSENWKNWMAAFQEAEGDIALPKFRMEYEVMLNSALKSLGMKSAFDPQQADFGAMTSAKSYVSAVKHKSFVEVKEEGTEAAAATSTEVRVVSMPIPGKRFQMIVNRPFFFAIRDNETGLILFLGSIVNPEQ